MRIGMRRTGTFILGVLVLSNGYAAGAGEELETSPLLTSARTSKKTVPAERIREALRAPDDDASETLLGTLVIKSSYDSSDTPGRIFLNGQLIYTARQQEELPYYRNRPFSLRLVSLQSNGKEFPDFRITRMVVEEHSWTCQYIVLDFTGDKVWISERFPKEAFQRGQCVNMTWARWEKNAAYFYFGADDSDWENGVYRGWVEGYNPKLKAVFGPVKAPSPPREYSLVPKLKPY